VVEAIRVLVSRPDFLTNPLRALSRRATWRLRWLLSNDPWSMPLSGMRILAPRGGAGALIHYQGFSEPETAAYLKDILREGMMFWDVGAHIGEYAILAAGIIGDTGGVCAFEANPELCSLLLQTVAMNRLANVHVLASAVCHRQGDVHFDICAEPSISSIRGGQESREGVVKTLLVPATTLDEWWDQDERRPDVIKVDVEGAERLVLQGSRRLLSLGAGDAATWIIEFSPENCRRSGYHPSALLSTFREYGYRTYWLTAGPKLTDTQAGPPGWRSSGNVVAIKSSL